MEVEAGVSPSLAQDTMVPPAAHANVRREKSLLRMVMSSSIQSTEYEKSVITVEMYDGMTIGSLEAPP